MSGSTYNNYDRWLPIAAFSVWCVALLVGMSLPYARAWGINLLSFASHEARVGFYLASFLSFSWIVFEWSSFHRTRRSTWPRWAGIPICLAAGAIASLLSAREAFLGDGTLRARDAMYATAILPSEILPTSLAAFVARNLPAELGVDGYVALRIVSVLCAVILVAFLWHLTPRAAEHGNRSVILWILTFGSVRLLAGYIETYTPAFVFFTLWALASWSCLNNRLGFGWVIGFWVMAILSHVTAILLVPATLYLLARAPNGEINLRSGPLRAFALLAVILGGAVIGAFYRFQVGGIGVGTGHFLVTLLSEPPNNYGLFSSGHLLDFVNHWFLIAPAFLVVGAMMLSRGLSLSRVSAGLSFITRPINSNVMFWLLAGALPVAVGFLIDPKLGWARDWDMYTLLSSPALVGMAIWLDGLTGRTRRAALAISVLSAGLWLTFSVDGRAERTRFEALLELDASRSDYGHEIMAQYYRRNGDHEGALRHYRAALAVSENLRYRINIGAAYGKLRKYDDAERWYRGVIARDSTMTDAYHGLSMVLAETGRMEEALSAAQTALTREPDNPDFLLQYGSVLVASKRFRDALPYLEKASEKMPREPAPQNALAVCYLELGRLEDAELRIQETIRREPMEAMIWLNGARVALARGDYAGARNRLEKYLALTPNEPGHSEAKRIADSLLARSANMP